MFFLNCTGLLSTPLAVAVSVRFFVVFATNYENKPLIWKTSKLSTFGANTIFSGLG